MLVCFDIDGTLADIEHRRAYVRTKPKNWKAFEAGIPNDTLNEFVATVLCDLYMQGHTIVLASGRGEQSRRDTVEWLDKHELNCYEKLYMRTEDF